MTIVNVIEDSNNPKKYLVISKPDSTNNPEQFITTTVTVTNRNIISLLEINKGIGGDRGEKGDKGDPGPPGQNGIIFDILPVNSGGTNNTNFDQDKIIYYDGSKLTSSNISINNIQTDIISNIYPGTGLSKTTDGSSVTINTNIGPGLKLNTSNQIEIDDIVITENNFILSQDYIQGILPVEKGGTNSSFFTTDRLVYFDGERIRSFNLPTGELVVNGMSVSIIAGPGITGGGNLNIPNGSVVIGLKESDDITIIDDSILLSEIGLSGIYTKVKTDTKGRIIEGSQLTFTDLTGVLGFVPWHINNDGQDSGLDADLLDGNHGYFYRDASNITGILDSNILSDSILSPGAYSKPVFNTKGIAVGYENLSFTEIINALGYIPFSSEGGIISDNLEVLGDLQIGGDINTQSNFFTIGDTGYTDDPRVIRFSYGSPPQIASLAYYPLSQKLIIFTPDGSGELITKEYGDSRYVNVTSQIQSITGVKLFLSNIRVDGQLILRMPKETTLPPLNVGNNNNLVPNLNTELFSDQNKDYYLDAWNHTGTLYTGIIIPHLEEGGSDYYFPIFRKTDDNSPMILDSSLVFQTGSWIYMDGTNLSVGFNTINTSTIYSLLVGNNNSVQNSTSSNIFLMGENNKARQTNTNSATIGYNNTISGANSSIVLNSNNIVSHDNSIAFGTYARSWIDNQIILGGNETYITNQAGASVKETQSQISLVPLKYRGEAPTWRTILDFDLLNNRTLQYDAELLFTKTKETGTASFSIATGIVKNYSYREPPNYETQNKTIIVEADSIDQQGDTVVIYSRENYNNSQERSYILNAEVSSNQESSSAITILDIRQKINLQNLDIRNTKDLYMISPKSDHSTLVKVTKQPSNVPSELLFNNPPPDHKHIICLSSFDEYPYNTGAMLNYGKNIGFKTECLYYRNPQDPNIYIKYHNHGINKNHPMSVDSFLKYGNYSLYEKTKNNFDFYLLKRNHRNINIASQPTNNSGIFRLYLNENIVGDFSGYGIISIYSQTGNYSSLNDRGLLWDSNLHKQLIFTYDISNLNSFSNNRYNLKNIDEFNNNLNINKISSSTWPTDLEISGTINPILGIVEFHISNFIFDGSTNTPNYPCILIGSIEGQDQYYCPKYIFSRDSILFNTNEYFSFIHKDKNFNYYDDNTIVTQEKIKAFVSGFYFTPLSTPFNIENRFDINFISNDNIIFNSGDTVLVSGIHNEISRIEKNNLGTTYLLSNDCKNTGLTDVIITSPISGIGFSNYPSFIISTGTYIFQYDNSYDLTGSTNIENLLIDNKPAKKIDYSFILDGPINDFSSQTKFNTQFSNQFFSNYTSVITRQTGIPKSSPINNIDISEALLLSESGTSCINNISCTSDIIIDNLSSKFFNLYLDGINLLSDISEIPIESSLQQLTDIGIVYDSANKISTLHFPFAVTGNLCLTYPVNYPHMSSSSLSDIIKPSKSYPILKNNNYKIIKYSDWFTHPLVGYGSIEATGSSRSNFTFDISNIKISDSLCSGYIRNNYSHHIIATGYFNINPTNIEQWRSDGLGSGVGFANVVIKENAGFRDYGEILNNETGVFASGLDNMLQYSIIYESIDIRIPSAASGSNIVSSSGNYIVIDPSLVSLFSVGDDIGITGILHYSTNEPILNYEEKSWTVDLIGSNFIQLSNFDNSIPSGNGGTIFKYYNTGIYNLDIDYIKKYHKLTVATEKDIDILRLYNMPSGDSIFNNLNIGYVFNNYSGIFCFSGMLNKFYGLLDNNSSFIISDSFSNNNKTFSVYFRSGVIDLPNNTEGSITLNYPSVYGVVSQNDLEDLENKQYINVAISSVIKNIEYPPNTKINMFSGGLYTPLNYLYGDKIYLYDFDNTFNYLDNCQYQEEIISSGTIYKNYFGYNLVGSKHGIWGRNFDGDTISAPIRNVSVFVDTFDSACSSGYICLKVSGLSFSPTVGDSFYLIVDPYICPQSGENSSQRNSTNFAKYLLKNTLDGPYKVHSKVEDNIFSFLAPIPSYFYKVNSPDYSSWNINTLTDENSQLPFTGFIRLLGSEDLVHKIQPFMPDSLVLFRNCSHTDFINDCDDCKLEKDCDFILSNNDTITLLPRIQSRPEDLEDAILLEKASRGISYGVDDIIQWKGVQRRGMQVWKEQNGRCDAILITGYQNLQVDKYPNFNDNFYDIRTDFYLENSLKEFGYNYIPITGSVDSDGLLYDHKPSMNNISSLNTKTSLGFGLFGTNKYLITYAVDKIIQSMLTSGDISSIISNPNADEWTTNDTAVLEDVFIINKSIDTFSVIGCEILISGDPNNRITPNNYTDNTVVFTGVRSQDSGIYRFAIHGGAGSYLLEPNIFVSGLLVSYLSSGNFIRGNTFVSSGISQYNYPIGPYSDIWYIDLSVNDLSNKSHDFIVQFQDDLWNNTEKITIKNENIRPEKPYLSNLTNKVFYAGGNAPFVFPFDIENLPASAKIRVSGDDERTPLSNYGIGYVQELNKWQGYILSIGQGITDDIIPVVFGITGSLIEGDEPYGLVYYSGNIICTGTPFLFDTPISNLDTSGYNFPLGSNVISYFNYQFPTHINTNNIPSIDIVGIPENITSFGTISTSVNITNGVTINPIQSMTPSIYKNNTKKDWMSIGFVTTDSVAFVPEIRISYSGNISILDNIAMHIYKNIAVENLIIPENIIYKNNNWSLSFETIEGAMSLQQPDIQIIDSPTPYSITKTYSNETNSWTISINGIGNKLDQNYPNTGLFELNIFANDRTSSTNLNIPMTYVYKPLFNYINDYYYGVKSKDYYISFDLNNSKDNYDSNINLNTNSFLPSDKTELYAKYNNILNIYEYAYRGEKILDKWDTRLVIGPIPNNRNISSSQPNINRTSIQLQIKGIDDDVLSIIGFIKMKELEAVDLSSRPLEIINIEPEEDGLEEIDQGKKWELSFDVIGGLQDIRFPPTIVLGGLPSICPGYYPENTVQSSCVDKAVFDNNSQKWQFAFTGNPLCVTGTYDVSIRAFDSTGEDTASLSFFYKPLKLVNPEIKVTGMSSEVYPNCAPFYGVVNYSASRRGGSCPYITGITGVQIIGSPPPGITYVDEGLSLRPSQPQPADYFYPTGSSRIVFQGLPTGPFPEGNVYPPMVVRVYDALGQTATKTLNFNVLGVSSMRQNPIGARLYFPSSGYFESVVKEGNEVKNEVKSFAQKAYIPYPYSGSFICRSNLFDNNCNTIYSGIYEKLNDSELSINFGPRIQGDEPVAAMVYTVFDYDDHGYNSGINDLYHISNIQAEDEYQDPQTGDVLLIYSGILSNSEKLEPFKFMEPPATGHVRYIEVKIEKFDMVDALLLKSVPPANTGCATCILGDGIIEAGKLKNKMKPSMIANITGLFYAKASDQEDAQVDETQSSISTNLMPGLEISGISWINNGGGEIHEFCFSNCYESGINLISGIIIPSPTVDIIDIPSFSYNGFNAAVQSRCAFGKDNPSKELLVIADDQSIHPNYRDLDFEYIIQSGIGTEDTIIVQNGTVTTPNEQVPVEGGTIVIQNQIVRKGTIYRLYLKRESDPFPTFDINSYNFMDKEYYWHQIYHTSDNPTKTEIENQEEMFHEPIPVFLPSGFKAFSGEPFDFRFEIIGGDHVSVSGNNNPKFTGNIIYFDTLEKVYTINNEDHNINFEILSNHTRDNNQQNGWRARITGIIEDIAESYINRYKIEIYTEQTGVGIPYNKNSTIHLPLTILKRQEIYLPKILGPNNDIVDGIEINVGNPLSFDLGIIGGNRSGHIHDNISVPLLEINDTICGINNGLTYLSTTDTWTGTIITDIQPPQNINTYAEYTYNITDNFSFHTGLFYVKVI